MNIAKGKKAELRKTEMSKCGKAKFCAKLLLRNILRCFFAQKSYATEAKF